MVSPGDPSQTPLHDDLVEMLTATGEAEHDLYGSLEPGARDAAGRIGDWSAKDVLGHLAAWRSIEARRLRGEVGAGSMPDAVSMPGEGTSGTTDPGPDDPIDETNARLQAERAHLPWDEVVAAADESIEALSAAIRATSAEALRGSSQLVAGIGANGANHALGHLFDVARLAGAEDRFRTLADRIEEILMRGRIPDDGTGTMLYNIACFEALAGRLDDARRLLRDAFRLRPDLVEWAEQDTDVAALKEELRALATSAEPAAG